MKKLLYALFLLPLFALTSCNNDDDFPEVDITVNMQQATHADGVVYIVKGEPFQINSLTVKSLTGENAALGEVGYYWNNILVGVNAIAPYTLAFDTNTMPTGKNQLQIRTNIFQVDKTITAAWLTYNIIVVPSKEDLPADAPELGIIEQTTRCTPTGE